MSYTIGEVLNHLTGEFDDVTISKIRFLEAEGLINPDRTDSGYRQFTEADIDRLRYVLRAQRDRYLPLKVIRSELDRIDAGLPVDESGVALEPTDEPTDQPAGEAPPLLSGPTGDVQLSLAELSEATGLESGDLQALREHGLLRGPDRFDGTDLVVARTAAALLAAGLEPRHLRMYRQFADRELALIEQLISHLLRQRNPDSRQAASELADSLAGDGAKLHRALLAREVRALLRS